MKRIVLLTASAVLGFTSPIALAQSHGEPARDAHAKHKEQGAPVNAMCPIGKEPIVPSAGTVEYKGHVIGLCCPSCGKNFLAWSERRKDEFIALAIAGKEPGHEAAPASAPVNQICPVCGDEVDPAMPTVLWNGHVIGFCCDGGQDMFNAWPDSKKREFVAMNSEPAPVSPYPLDRCPVSGQKLGSMGDPVVRNYDGREVRFCCANCIDKFEAAKAAYFKQIEERIIADQLRYYPADTCVVSGEPLVENGQDIAVNTVVANRLVRTCCKMCIRKLQANPQEFIAKLDKAASNAQRPDYPLTTCLVSGGALGSMGEPAEIVVAGRLMRFCCANCEPKVKADPAKYIAAIDEAWHDKGMFLPQDADEEHAEEHDGHGDHDHD